MILEEKKPFEDKMLCISLAPEKVDYSTDRSKAVVQVLFLLFVLFLCVVMLALWSSSSIAAHFAFCFISCD